MRAIILAGGKGTRLAPYTTVLPKPLMPVGDMPVLEIVIRQLAKYGFDHVTIAVNHQAQIIQAFFEDGAKWNIKIDYSLETVPLSTMGPLKLIKNLPENFLVMNGDVLTDVDFGWFYDQHINNGSVFTILSNQRVLKSEYGVLDIDVNGMLKGFREKPEFQFDVSTGIYMANRAILRFIPDNIQFGFDNLMVSLMKNKNPAAVIKYSGYWLDIGRPDDFAQANAEYHTKVRSIF